MLRLLVCCSLLCLLASTAAAQRATIKQATPGLVTEAAAEYLRPDGFVLTRNDSSQAVFGLNRGRMAQHGLYHGMRGNNIFWVVMEVHLQFKQKPEGLEVTAYEDAVVLEDDSALVQRRRVNSHGELDNLRQFLRDLQRRVEARISGTNRR